MTKTFSQQFSGINSGSISNCYEKLLQKLTVRSRLITASPVTPHKCCENLNRGISKIMLFTFIEISRRRSHLPSRAWWGNIKGKTKQAMESVKIQSVLCGDMLRVKRVIVVWRSIEQLLLFPQRSVKKNNKQSNWYCLHKAVNGGTQNYANSKVV